MTSRRPDVERKALSDDHLAVAQGMADVATIGLLHDRALRDQVVLAEQLQTALHSRIVIEEAKGVLSARAGILEYADLRPADDLRRGPGSPSTAQTSE